MNYIKNIKYLSYLREFIPNPSAMYVKMNNKNICINILAVSVQIKSQIYLLGCKLCVINFQLKKKTSISLKLI